MKHETYKQIRKILIHEQTILMLHAKVPDILNLSEAQLQAFNEMVDREAAYINLAIEKFDLSEEAYLTLQQEQTTRIVIQNKATSINEKLTQIKTIKRWTDKQLAHYFDISTAAIYALRAGKTQRFRIEAINMQINKEYDDLIRSQQGDN